MSRPPLTPMLAAVAATGGALVEGTIDCDGPVGASSGLQTPYAGPVQLTIAPDSDTTEAWAVASAEP